MRAILRSVFVPFALSVALAASGCASSEPGDFSEGGHDGGDASAVCTGTRTEVDTAGYHSTPACADTYEAALANPPSCGGGNYEHIGIGDCGSVHIIKADCSLHGIYCAYDGTSGAFVGEAAYDDVPERCGMTSSCIQYGTLGTALSCRNDGVAGTCPLTALGADAGDSDASDAQPVDVQPYDAGPYSCGSQTCGSNQVCVHPCSGIDAGNGGPQPSCVDVPPSCGESSCDCVHPSACPGTDAGFGGYPSCTQRTPGSRDLFCQGCA